IIGVAVIAIGIGVYLATSRKSPPPAPQRVAQNIEAPAQAAVAPAAPAAPLAISSGRKLKDLGLALSMYAGAHRGRFPDSLDALVPRLLSGDALIDPTTGKSFEYRGQGKRSPTPFEAPEVIAYSAEPSPVVPVLLSDGAVKAMARDRLAQIVESPQPESVSPPASNPAEVESDANAGAAADLLSWADLVDHPERWPAEIKVTVPLRFDRGILQAGASVRVYQVTANEVTILTPQEIALDIRPTECDLLKVANRFWAALTPEQRAIDATAVANDASLWPDIVKTKISLTFDLVNGQSRRLPAGSQCTLAYYDGKVAVASPVGEDTHLEFKITELDLIERARERMLVDPAKRPS